MKEKTKAYMGGLMDTDGTFGIHYITPTDPKRYGQFNTNVEFYNNSTKLMEWVVKHFGGTFKLKAEAHGNYATQYRWYPEFGPHLVEFIDTIIPYLVVKRGEAGCIKEFKALGFKQKKPLEREVLRARCSWYKQNRSVVETDMLNNFFTWKNNLIHAYLAGLIDGDGCICSTQPNLVINIGNKCKPLLDCIKSMYGGSVGPSEDDDDFIWQLSGLNKQALFLQHIAPYLVLKRDKAVESLAEVRRKLSNPIRPGTKELKIQSVLYGDI